MEGKNDWRTDPCMEGHTVPTIPLPELSYSWIDVTHVSPVAFLLQQHHPLRLNKTPRRHPVDVDPAGQPSAIKGD